MEAAAQVAETPMLRSLVLALAIAAPAGVAAAEEFPRAAQGALVVADDGTPLGRVGRVERNARGEIVAAEIEGLEPADAPPEPQLVAEVSQRTLVRMDRQQQPQRREGGQGLRMQRAR